MPGNGRLKTVHFTVAFIPRGFHYTHYSGSFSKTQGQRKLKKRKSEKHSNTY